MLGKQNIWIKQGDDVRIVLPCPEALPGDVASSQIKRWPGGPLLATFTCSLDLAALTVTLRLPPKVSRTTKRSGRYDVQLLGPTGLRTVIEGAAVLRPEVTTPVDGYIDALTYNEYHALTYSDYHALTYNKLRGVA